MHHSAREEDRLCTLVRDAQRAATDVERDRLEGEVITQCRPVSWGIARRYAGRGAELDDLRAVADLAVLGAIRRFDPSRDGFLGYASVTVLGEIKKYFRDSCWTIRPTRSVQELQSRLSAAAVELQHEGDGATVLTLARRLGVTPAQVAEASAAKSCFTPTSLDAAAPGQDDSRPVDLPVEDGGFVLIEDRLAAARACATLSRAELELLRLRFFEDLTQRQIAAQLGTTQVQVSRELRRIVARLRATLDDSSPVKAVS